MLPELTKPFIFVVLEVCPFGTHVMMKKRHIFFF
jgi:hypothetical protein